MISNNSATIRFSYFAIKAQWGMLPINEEETLVNLKERRVNRKYFRITKNEHMIDHLS